MRTAIPVALVLGTVEAASTMALEARDQRLGCDALNGPITAAIDKVAKKMFPRFPPRR